VESLGTVEAAEKQCPKLIRRALLKDDRHFPGSILLLEDATTKSCGTAILQAGLTVLRLRFRTMP
jgi:hypothetical protein